MKTEYNSEVKALAKTLHDKHGAVTLDDKATSIELGCAVITLKINRAKAVGIPYSKFGRSVKYSIFDIANYIVNNKVKVMS